MGITRIYSVQEEYKDLDQTFESLKGKRSEKIIESMRLYTMIYGEGKCKMPHVMDSMSKWKLYLEALSYDQKVKFDNWFNSLNEMYIKEIIDAS